MRAEIDFAEFVRNSGTSLLRTAFLLTGERHTAEDLVQDTLTALYPKWARVNGADEPLAYVRQSLVNRFLSSRRKASSRDVLLASIPNRPDLRDVAATVIDRETLMSMLATLPERQRAAVVLRYLNDLSDEDIAAHLSCRTATVRSLISRGFATLRAEFAATIADRNTA